MGSSVKTLSRPRCGNCGKRIFRPYSRFKNYMWRQIPSHCPYCGEELSFDKKERLVEYEEFLWMLLCLAVIIFFIVIAVIFL